MSGVFFFLKSLFFPNIPHSLRRNRNMLILLRITLLLTAIMFWLKIKMLIQVAIINVRSSLTAFRPHKSWGQFMMLGLWVTPWMEERSSCGCDSTTVICLCVLCISLSSIWNHSLVVSPDTLCINIILYLSFPQSSFANIYFYPDHAPSSQLLKYLLSCFFFFFNATPRLSFNTLSCTQAWKLLLPLPHIFYLHGLDNTKETIMYVFSLVMQTFHCLNFYLHWPSSGKLNPCKVYLFYVSFFAK